MMFIHIIGIKNSICETIMNDESWIEIEEGVEMYQRQGRSFLEKPTKPINDLKQVKIYTDGACRKNPGPGGWAAILLSGEHKKEIFGNESNTTNNRMELTAVIQALSALKEKCDVIVYSDSQYVINAFVLDWINKWRINGWRIGTKELKNDDLWKTLYDLSRKHEIEWTWVKGHAGNRMNERADYLANKAIK